METRPASIRGGFDSVLVGITSGMVFHILTRVGFKVVLGASNLPYLVCLHFIYC